MARTAAEMDDCTVIDDRPIALRRKKRSSSVLADQVAQPKLEPTHIANSFPADSIKTPPKAKKKVRFSDPGPDGSGPLSSTGLTPAFSRTSFGSIMPLSTQIKQSRPRRLASLPNIRSTAAVTSPSPMLSPVSLSGEIQFIPWCDIMDDRSKRRLKRNHLSEVQNEYEAGKRPEKKSAIEYEQEIHGLKFELASLKKQQMRGEAEGATSALKGLNREKELESEIDRLKQEMNDDDPRTKPRHDTSPHVDPETPMLSVGDDEGIDPSESHFGPNVVLDAQAPTPAPPTYTDASTEASIQDSRDADMLRTARLNLEYLFPGEIALGLVPDGWKPLFDTVMQQMSSLRARTLIAEDAQSTTDMQVKNIRNQFNKTLEQLNRARHYSEKVGAKHKEENARAEKAEQNAQALQEDIKATSIRVQQLESSSDEKDRSLKKLQGALESYRTEVGKLETLIVDMDKNHAADIAKVRSEMDEAVADLECHVTAETAGRREAEAEVERNDQKIRELQVRVKELKNAVHEKQTTLRNIDTAFSKEKSARKRADHDNTQLNAQVNKLRHNVQTSDKRYEHADHMCGLLRNTLEEERRAAVRALAAVQEEVTHLSNNANGIQSAHIQDSKKRSAEVLEHQGLLTPTTGGRFRDGEEIEGMDGIEIHRGKKTQARKRPDSGIVILEEDEDEEMEMNDA